MDTKLLEDIGLTSGETKVYLALLRIGESKTGQIAKEAVVSSSKVYKILDRLMKKGLAGYVTKGKTKYFSAFEPKRILQYMEEKEKERSEKKQLIEKLIPELELEQKMASQSDAVIYDGFRAISNFFLNILDELKKGEEYYVLGALYADIPGLRAFFTKYHTMRADKGIKLKMLANYDIQDIVPSTRRNSEIRVLPKYIITPMQLLFYKEKAFIILWTKSPVGFLIKNKEAVESFRKYFDAFWNIAK